MVRSILAALVRLVAGGGLLLLAVAFVSTVQAATIIKANNTASWNAVTSWVGGVAPGVLDVAQWDATITGSNTTTLGAGFNLGKIGVLDPGGPVTINADGNTLGLYGINGTGIDMSSATQNLTLNCPIVLGSTQTWTVASGRAERVKRFETTAVRN